MGTNLQEIADMLAFTEEILNAKLFFCIIFYVLYICVLSCVIDIIEIMENAPQKSSVVELIIRPATLLTTDYSLNGLLYIVPCFYIVSRLSFRMTVWLVWLNG